MSDPRLEVIAVCEDQTGKEEYTLASVRLTEQTSKAIVLAIVRDTINSLANMNMLIYVHQRDFVLAEPDANAPLDPDAMYLRFLVVSAFARPTPPNRPTLNDLPDSFWIRH